MIILDDLEHKDLPIIWNALFLQATFDFNGVYCGSGSTITFKLRNQVRVTALYDSHLLITDDIFFFCLNIFSPFNTWNSFKEMLLRFQNLESET